MSKTFFIASKNNEKTNILRDIGVPDSVELRFSFAESALCLVGLPISITCEITTAMLWDNLNRLA